jgi:nucleotidyltransferase substrate binding protein (TIGR01987 family)
MDNELILGKVNIQPLLKIKAQLDHALANIEDELDRTGAIKIFEMGFELSWKILKKVLQEKGLIEAQNPKDVFRSAATQGYIKDPELWFAFQETRNLTVHTYNENTAELIFSSLDEFQTELNTLIETLKKLK